MAKRAAKRVQDPMLRKFVEGYLDAALWSSSDEDGPLDQKYSLADFAREAVEKATEDAAEFIEANREDLISTGASDDRLGHDFWLTRNRHGSGFWDEGYGPAGDRLTEASHGYGETYLYAGDDGKLYFG